MVLCSRTPRPRAFPPFVFVVATIANDAAEATAASWSGPAGSAGARLGNPGSFDTNAGCAVEDAIGMISPFVETSFTENARQ